ncbi:CAP domain-containing protein [Streptomyces syringium]|uniref:CAP domain-containing protein n=1 Tax=Streptomyces syringium TaxID=76729 RepID=UPI003427A7B5
MDSSWHPESRRVPGRGLSLALVATMAGFIVFVWSLSGSQVDWSSRSQNVGYRPPGPVWTLVVAGVPGDMGWEPREGLTGLPAAGSRVSSPAALGIWSSPALVDSVDGFRRIILDLVNGERRGHGCGPLRLDPQLQRSAQSHADDMAVRNYYDHNTPEGADPGFRMLAAGYHWSGWGENLLRGSLDPKSAVEGWMASHGHRHNILDCAWTDTGIGVNLSSTGPWWTQDFAVRG